MSLYKRVRSLFVRDAGFRIDTVIAIPQAAAGEPFEQSVRKTVSEFKQIPLDQVTDDLAIGFEGRSICMSLVFTLGVSLAVSTDTTVGEMISQVRSQLK